MSAGATPHRHPLARRCLADVGLPEPLARDELLQSGQFVDLISNIPPGADELGRYPAAVPHGLQDAYAQFASAEAGVTDGALTGDHVLFTDGSVAGIDLLVRAFCEPFADRVCVCPPTFPFYARAARANDVDVVEVPLQGPSYDRLDIDGLMSSASKLVFLCSPGNPVGSALCEEDLLGLMEAAPGLVVIDEAYVEFGSRPSAVRRVPRCPALVVLRTFSKAWGMAGIRTGAVVADPTVLTTLRMVQLTYAVAAPARALLARALEDPAPLRARVAEVCARREALRNALERRPAVRRVYPSEANFLCVEFADATAARRALSAAGLLVADTSAAVPGTLRISVGSAVANARLLDALDEGEA